MSRAISRLGSLFIFLLSVGILKSAELSEYDEKVIKLFREFGFLNEPPSFPKDHAYWDDLAWYKEQGKKVRPALEYLFTTDLKNEPAKRSMVLNALSTSPGDQSMLLQSIRDEIGDLERYKGKFGYHGLLKSFLSFLGTHGAIEDVEIISPFLEDKDVLIRSTARSQIASLENRMQSQPSRNNEKSNRIENYKNVKDETTGLETRAGKKSRLVSWFYWTLVPVILGGLSLLIWNSRKGSLTQ